MSTIKLSFTCDEDVRQAAIFVAELVRQGVVFTTDTREVDHVLVITFTGGF